MQATQETIDELRESAGNAVSETAMASRALLYRAANTIESEAYARRDAEARADVLLGRLALYGAALAQFEKAMRDCSGHPDTSTDRDSLRAAAESARNVLSGGAKASLPTKEALAELIAEKLAGTYHCGRVWEAWRHGTMAEDDFSDVGESDTPAELADAVLAMLLGPRKDEAPKPSEVQSQAWMGPARLLTQWRNCLSYNDSYVGEPAGLFKQAIAQLDRLLPAVPVKAAVSADAKGGAL